MQSLAGAAFYLGMIAYSAASTLFFLDLLRPALSKRSMAPWVLALAGVFHAAHVVSASFLSHTCPIDSLHFALSLSALMAVVVFLALRPRLKLDALGVLVAPLGLSFLLGAKFVSTGNTAPSSVPRSLLLMHIGANLLGIGLFLLAGAAGAFYVVEERRLKHKKLGMASRLPPLASLDRAAHRLLLAGFPLLTFGVVTGSVFLDRLSSVHGLELVRSLIGYASWLLFALVLVLRQSSGFGGRRAAYGTLVGVAGVLVVMLVYVFGAS
ncbi:MAG: cytochrome c biogenesis protein CcsA [Polyangiaceae bacterium]